MKRGPETGNSVGPAILAGLAAFFSCKRYRAASSRELDEQLPPCEKIGARLHRLICLMCRRFSNQLKIIDLACRKYEQAAAEGGTLDGDYLKQHKLSSECCNRITKKLGETPVDS
jgi:hypothetical protein